MRFISISAAAFAASMFTLSAPAFAGCVGSDSFQTCTDNSGNSYNVSRFGNTTQVTGNNYQTGSSWSQTSQTIGNSTYTNGQAANGNSWNSTTQRIGGTTYTNGMDSNGNSFSSTCNSFGCN